VGRRDGSRRRARPNAPPEDLRHVYDPRADLAVHDTRLFFASECAAACEERRIATDARDVERWCNRLAFNIPDEPGRPDNAVAYYDALRTRVYATPLLRLCWLFCTFATLEPDELYCVLMDDDEYKGDAKRFVFNRYLFDCPLPVLHSCESILATLRGERTAAGTGVGTGRRTDTGCAQERGEASTTHLGSKKRKNEA